MIRKGESLPGHPFHGPPIPKVSTNQIPFNLTASYLQTQSVGKPPPFSYFPGLPSSSPAKEPNYNIWQPLPPPADCQTNETEEHAHALPGTDQIYPAYEQQTQQFEHHPSKDGSWSQQPSITDDWTEAQIQMPQSVFTNSDPRGMLGIPESCGGPEGVTFLSPETGFQVPPPDTSHRLALNSHSFTEQNFTPAPLQYGLSKIQYSPLGVQQNLSLLQTVANELPDVGETMSWSQPPGVIGERPEAQMQIPPATFTSINPRTMLGIPESHNGPQGDPFLSLGTCFPVPPPDAIPRLPMNHHNIPNNQFTPTAFQGAQHSSLGAQHDLTFVQNPSSGARWTPHWPPPPLPPPPQSLPPPTHWQTRPAAPPPYNPFEVHQSMFGYSPGLPGMHPYFGVQPVMNHLQYPYPNSMNMFSASSQLPVRGTEPANGHPENLWSLRRTQKPRTGYREGGKCSRSSRNSFRQKNDAPQTLVDDTDETSDSSAGSEKEEAPQTPTIKIRGINTLMMATKCKYYFQNPNKGGGETQEVKWDNIEHIYYITFSDAKVAKRVSSHVHKINNQQLEISLAPRGIPESVGMRTVEISGGDVKYLEVYTLYFENPNNGGGPISKIWHDKQKEKLYITFEDAAVAETVCSRSHKVEEHILEAKLANMDQTNMDQTNMDQTNMDQTNMDQTNMDQTNDAIGNLEQFHEERTTVEITVEPPLRNEQFYRQYLEAQGYEGLVDDLLLDTENGKVLVTFHDVKGAQQFASCEHKIDGKDVQTNLTKNSSFYQDKLFFRNVPRNIPKEMVMQYMEIISGQEGIDLVYSDEPGGVLVTFHSKIGKYCKRIVKDFTKIRDKCQARLLKACRLEVSKVPVSNCILVENLNVNTTDDDVAHYFESTRVGGSTVLRVEHVEDQRKCVFFEDPEAARRVALKKHLCGGRKLRVRLYLDCLGPYGGSEDPYVLILPEPLEVSVKDNIKVHFLQHGTMILQNFNERLSTFHARATAVDGVLKIACTLKESLPRVHLLVNGWRDEIKKQADVCFDSVRLDRLEVLPEIWPDVMKTVEECKVSGDDMILPLVDEHMLVILGRKNVERNTFEKMKAIVDKWEKELALKKGEVSKTKNLKKHELDLLIMFSFPSIIEEQYNRLSVKIAEQEGKITFHGQLADIREVEIKIIDILQTVSSKMVMNLTNSKLSLLSSQGSRDIVGQKLKSQGLKATWACHKEGIVTVYCFNESDLEKAVDVIQTSLMEEAFPLDEVSSKVVLNNPDWETLKKDLLQTHMGLFTISTKDNIILLTAVSDIMPSVQPQILDFVSENSIYFTDFRFSPSRHEFLRLYWKDRLKLIAEKLSKYKVDITVTDQTSTIRVTGINHGIKRVRQKLEALEEYIVCTEERITNKDTIACLVALKNTTELDYMTKAHQCVVSWHPEESGIQIVSTNQPVKRKKRTGNHSMVSAMKANITELAVDAIVNAANARMQHGGGVAGAIVAKGGRAIQEECNRTIEVRGKLSEGDVLVSGPGKLPCKAIIHAVGPRYKGGNKGEEECLRRTVFNCLKTASDRGYTSIALPAISSGIFGYPVEEATRVIVEAVRSYFQSTTGSSVRDVRLCDIVQSTVDLFQTALDEISLGEETAVITHDSDVLHEKNSTALRDSFWKLPEGSQGIRVVVVEGEIARQDSDVIVNSTSHDLNLIKGAISSSILKAAGPGLQRECREKYPKGITGDKIACTNSFNMRCKAIFHVALCYWSNKGTAAKQLESLVESCLKEASKRHFTSMAMPALGTGVLGFPREVAARTIISTVNRFQQTSPNTSLKEVKVVVFNDKKTLEAFDAADSSQMKSPETEIGTEIEEETDSLASFGGGSEEVFRNGENEPAKHLTHLPVGLTVTPAKAVFSEAATYERDSSFDLDGLCLTIKKGDITEEVVDAIVNSTNAHLDLSRGTVSNVLRAKCGKDLEWECKAKHMARHNIVMTAAYNLKCKHILHIDALSYKKPDVWEKAYTAILQEAEKKGLHSLAVPALGTGNIKLSPLASAQALATALTVHKQSMNTLRKVTVVLYESSTVQTFSEVLKTLGKQDTSPLPRNPDKDVPKKSFFQRALETIGLPFKARRDHVPDEFNFYVFAAKEDNRNEFLTALYKFLDGKYDNKEMKELENLSTEELKEVKKACKAFNVEVQRKPTGAIVLRGMPEDVEKSREMIAKLIKETEQQRQETVMANLVQWYYFERATTGTERKAFGKKENLRIEDAYQIDQMNESVELCDDNDNAYIVNFTEMKKYFKVDPSDCVKVMRKEKLKDGANSASLLPDNWDLQEEEEAVKLVPLSSGSEEYKSVLENFSRTTKGNNTVNSIQRIQNPELYKQYLAKKAQMNKRNKEMDSEKTLWHGTSSDVIQYINRDGFNRSFCGKNATRYGQGVYFAVNSTYSMQDIYSARDHLGNKYIYQCRVLVGHSTKGFHEMKTLPLREGTIRYDSATNDTHNPTMYIIFHDSQAYPEYLITFT